MTCLQLLEIGDCSMAWWIVKAACEVLLPKQAIVKNDPGRTRTFNLTIKSRLLCQIELQGHVKYCAQRGDYSLDKQSATRVKPSSAARFRLAQDKRARPATFRRYITVE